MFLTFINSNLFNPIYPSRAADSPNITLVDIFAPINLVSRLRKCRVSMTQSQRGLATIHTLPLDLCVLLGAAATYEPRTWMTPPLETLMTL